MERILKYVGIFENNYEKIYIPSLESKLKYELLEYLSEHKIEHENVCEDTIAYINQLLSDSSCTLSRDEALNLMLNLLNQITVEGKKNLTCYKKEFLFLFDQLR